MYDIGPCGVSRYAMQFASTLHVVASHHAPACDDTPVEPTGQSEGGMSIASASATAGSSEKSTTTENVRRMGRA